MATKAPVESKSFVTQMVEFPQESWAELKKVHAPTRQETIMLTIRVLGMVAVFGVFLGLTDYVVGGAMHWILTHG